MTEPYFIRLKGGKQANFPSFGSDSAGDCLMAILPPDAEMEEDRFRDVCVFLLYGDGGLPTLRDDGGNILFTFADSRGPEEISVLFPLGSFLCGALTESRMIDADRVRNLSRAGAGIIVALAGEETGREGLLAAVARTRATENEVFFVLATPGKAPAIFDPLGEAVYPVLSPLGKDYVLDRAELPSPK